MAKFRALLSYLAIAAIIYMSGDSAYGATYVPQMHFFLVVIFLLLVVAYLWKRKINKKMTGVYLLSCAAVTTSMIFNFDFSGFSMFLILGISLMLSDLVAFDDFYKIFENIVLLLAVCSIIGFLIHNIRPDILANFPTIKGGGGKLKNLYLTTVPIDPYAGYLHRSYGIFREPAMFGIYLGLALCRQMLFCKKMSYIRCGIYMVAIYQTKSMTAYIAFAALFIVWLLGRKIPRKKKAIFLSALIIAALLLSYKTNLVSYMMERFNRTGGSSHSINSRIASITVGLYVFLLHPLFGAGATNAQNLFISSLPKLGYDSNLTATNMTLYLMSAFGIFFGIVFIAGLIGVGCYSGCGRTGKFGFPLVVLLLLCGETMTYSCTIYVFMFYGLHYMLEHKVNETDGMYASWVG